MPNEPAPTPKTDAEVAHHSATLGLGICSADFARHLELELNTTKALLAQCEDDYERTGAALDSMIEESAAWKEDAARSAEELKVLAEMQATIQLDAIKHGMTMAAAIMDSYYQSQELCESKQEILTARDNLKGHPTTKGAA